VVASAPDHSPPHLIKQPRTSIVKAAEKLHRAIGLGRIREGVRKANSIRIDHECLETPLFIGISAQHFGDALDLLHRQLGGGPRHVDDFAEAGHAFCQQCAATSRRTSPSILPDVVLGKDRLYLLTPELHRAA
jgi:hypothetical protein